MLRLKFLVRGLQGRPKYESEEVFVSTLSAAYASLPSALRFVLRYHSRLADPPFNRPTFLVT